MRDVRHGAIAVTWATAGTRTAAFGPVLGGSLSGAAGSIVGQASASRTLGLEVSTIKNHVHNIIVKLCVKNRGEAAAMLSATPPAANDRIVDAVG